MSLRQVCFDIETSGVDVENDRILTCYAQVQDGDQILETGSWTINPGVEIPEGASEIHGMTTEWIREHGRKDAGDAIDEIAKFLSEWAHRGFVITGFNHSFDLGMLDRECRRYGIEPLPRGLLYVCPLVLDRLIDKYRKGKRTLAAVATHYGVDFNEEEAHAADYDVKVTAQLVPKVLNATVRKLPVLQGLTPEEILAKLQGIQKEAKAEWADHLTEYWRKNGIVDEKGGARVASGRFPW